MPRGVPKKKVAIYVATESFATEKYGSPGRWRDIAACNGIEDPLRVRPGDRVYLPNPDELAGDRR